MSDAPPTVPDAASKAKLDRDFAELYRTHLRDVYSYSYYQSRELTTTPRT